MASEIKANKLSPASGANIVLGNSGNTFTLPSGATLSGAGSITVPSGGSLTIDSGATITNNGTGSGFGKILNVWHLNQSTYGSIGNTTTFQNFSDLYVTLTPQSTNSKFLLQASFSGDNTGSAGYGSLTIFRDSTNFHTSGGSAGLSSVEFANVMMWASWLDSPATTSSITYRPKLWYNGGTVQFGTSWTRPSFLVVEIDS